jgi:hypothetical protein
MDNVTPSTVSVSEKPITGDGVFLVTRNSHPAEPLHNTTLCRIEAPCEIAPMSIRIPVKRITMFSLQLLFRVWQRKRSRWCNNYMRCVGIGARNSLV